MEEDPYDSPWDDCAQLEFVDVLPSQTPPPPCPNATHMEECSGMIAANCDLCGAAACEWCLDYDSDGYVTCGGLLREQNETLCAERRGAARGDVVASGA